MAAINKNIKIIFNRELAGYFETPVAYVVIVVFLLLSGVFTFYLGNFYERNQADLESFFVWHPWLYLFLIPSISMRLWSEERKAGTIELLMTLPCSTPHAVIGKFLAAWCFAVIALLCTIPLWVTTAFLGDADNGAIFSGYIGSALLAGGYLAIGSSMSALTRNQIVAFVLSITVCFLFTVSGFPIVIDFFSFWLPQIIVDTISTFSLTSHFDELTKGVISAKHIIYFTTLIVFWLWMNTLIVNVKRA